MGGRSSAGWRMGVLGVPLDRWREEADVKSASCLKNRCEQPRYRDWEDPARHVVWECGRRRQNSFGEPSADGQCGLL